MTGPEHYRAAEMLLNAMAEQQVTGGSIARGDVQAAAAVAQVHATLALAAPKPLPVIEFRHPHDERIDLLVNGREVASANHDEHGWDGMDAFAKAAMAIVKAFGGEIGEAEASNDDEADDRG